MSLAHQYHNVLALESKHLVVQGAFQQVCTDHQSLRDEVEASVSELAEFEKVEPENYKSQVDKMKALIALRARMEKKGQEESALRPQFVAIRGEYDAARKSHMKKLEKVDKKEAGAQKKHKKEARAQKKRKKDVAVAPVAMAAAAAQAATKKNKKICLVGAGQRLHKLPELADSSADESDDELADESDSEAARESADEAAYEADRLSDTDSADEAAYESESDGEKICNADRPNNKRKNNATERTTTPADQEAGKVTRFIMKKAKGVALKVISYDRNSDESSDDESSDDESSDEDDQPLSLRQHTNSM